MGPQPPSLASCVRNTGPGPVSRGACVSRVSRWAAPWLLFPPRVGATAQAPRSSPRPEDPQEGNVLLIICTTSLFGWKALLQNPSLILSPKRGILCFRLANQETWAGVCLQDSGPAFQCRRPRKCPKTQRFLTGQWQAPSRANL